MLAATISMMAGAVCGKALPKDAIVSVKASEVKVRGHVAEVQDRFFRERIFSDFAKNEIWKEAHDAFAHPDDDVFKNGIGMWKGEFWGKLMISASRVAEYSHDAALKEFLHQEALKLITYQHEDGYLGTYVDKEYVVPLPIEEQQRRIGWPCPWNWNLWCRKYTLWGLMSAYRLTGDRKLLVAADRAMTQQIDMLHRRNLRLCDTGTSSMHGFPPCSILKPLLWLYQDTGKAKFLDYAKEIYGYFSDPSCQAVQFAAKLKTGKPLDEWYPEENGSWGKAYEMMSCLAGFVEYYRFTGDESALEVAKGMRERILADELNLCLSVGYNDQFWCAKKRLNGVSEPCDAIHWMRLNHELYLVTGEAKYVDEIERCFYNAFLAAVRPDGKWGARCVRSHGRHQPAPPQSGMHLQHCCVNNMPRGFMDAAQTILAKDAGGALLVGLYHDAEAAIGGDRVEIAGGYPVNDAVTVGISKERAGKVKFRVPEWCDGLTVCGGGLCMRAKRPGWFEVEVPAGKSEWKLEFGMKARIIDSRRERVDGYSKDSRLYWRWANNSDGDGNERDLFPLLRTEPAAQVMYGPLMLAKSVRMGEGADEILDGETVNLGGWRVFSDTMTTDKAWGAWRLTFEKAGRRKTIKACDYSSAAIWGKKGIEFSIFF